MARQFRRLFMPMGDARAVKKRQQDIRRGADKQQAFIKRLKDKRESAAQIAVKAAIEDFRRWYC